MADNASLHFKYWIGILIGIIILIATAAWAADPRIADKINFAVGITSVALALVAMYVTIAFNGFFSNNVTTFLGLNRQIEDSATKLLAATNELNAKLDLVPVGFEGLSQKLDATTEKWLQQSLSSATASEVQSGEPGKVERTVSWTEPMLRWTFLNSQFEAMLGFYLVAKASYKGKVFTATEFERELPLLDFAYFRGVAGMLKALKLCTYKNVKGTYVTSNADEILVSHINKWMDQTIKFSRDNGLPAIKVLEPGRKQIDSFVDTKAKTEQSPTTAVSPPSSGEST